MDRLPSLKALKVFEAAARHLSFSSAANELHLTPSAVSHQIRRLEEELDVVLFQRLTRRVALTEKGKAYFGSVHMALEVIADATGRLRSHAAADVLKISVVPFFGINWLMPRLWMFETAFPEIEVRLSSSVELVDFRTSDFDLAVRFGRGNWRGVQCTRLMAEDLVPVCSPALLTGPDALKVPEDLARRTLIHVVPRAEEWRMWLQAAGVEGVDPTAGPRFQGAVTALEAAVAGRGVAIGDRRLVGRDLAAGRLVEPFDISLPSESAYYLVYPSEHADLPKIGSFRDWLMAEVRKAAEADGLSSSRLE